MYSNNKNPEISIILPCLNEEETIGECIDKLKEIIKKENLDTEIIAVDNNSTDKSAEIIKSKNVRYKFEKTRGYGSAYLSGFKEAKGKYIFMADSDGSYDLHALPKFIEGLKEGNEFVIGDRFKGKMEKKSMPFLHKYIGNPLLSGTLRLFFKTKIHDAHCGIRAIRKDALDKLNLQTTGMEFASEMIVKSLKHKLKVKEIPTNYNERKGESKLKTFRDGWRHLRFMLLFSPYYLFFLPGLILFLIGLMSMTLMYTTNPVLFGIQFFYHPMFISSLFMIIGYQMIIFNIFSRTYASTHLNEKSKLEKFYKYITIEKAGTIGILLILSGLAIFIGILIKWKNAGFQGLNEIENSILALTIITLGAQTIFSSFMLSILGIKEK